MKKLLILFAICLLPLSLSAETKLNGFKSPEDCLKKLAESCQKKDTKGIAHTFDSQFRGYFLGLHDFYQSALALRAAIDSKFGKEVNQKLKLDKIDRAITGPFDFGKGGAVKIVKTDGNVALGEILFTGSKSPKKYELKKGASGWLIAGPGEKRPGMEVMLNALSKMGPPFSAYAKDVKSLADKVSKGEIKSGDECEKAAKALEQQFQVKMRKIFMDISLKARAAAMKKAKEAMKKAEEAKKRAEEARKKAEEARKKAEGSKK